MKGDGQATGIADTPAADLHRIFVAWSTKGGGDPSKHSAAQLRSIVGSSAGTLEELRRAVRLLDAIMLWLDEAKRSDADLEAYASYVERWAQAIFFYPGDWSAAGGNKHFTDDMLSALRTLSSLMRAHGVRLDKQHLGSMLDLLREIEEEAENDNDLPADLRDFLGTTAHELRRVYADYSRASRFDFNMARKSLKIALDLAAERSGHKDSAWAQFRERWAAPVTVNALGGIAAQAGLLAISMNGG